MLLGARVAPDWLRERGAGAREARTPPRPCPRQKQSPAETGASAAFRRFWLALPRGGATVRTNLGGARPARCVGPRRSPWEQPGAPLKARENLKVA